VRLNGKQLLFGGPSKQSQRGTSKLLMKHKPVSCCTNKPAAGIVIKKIFPSIILPRQQMRSSVGESP